MGRYELRAREEERRAKELVKEKTEKALRKKAFEDMQRQAAIDAQVIAAKATSIAATDDEEAKLINKRNEDGEARANKLEHEQKIIAKVESQVRLDSESFSSQKEQEAKQRREQLAEDHRQIIFSRIVLEKDTKAELSRKAKEEMAKSTWSQRQMEKSIEETKQKLGEKERIGVLSHFDEVTKRHKEEAERRMMEGRQRFHTDEDNRKANKDRRKNNKMADHVAAKKNMTTMAEERKKAEKAEKKKLLAAQKEFLASKQKQQAGKAKLEKKFKKEEEEALAQHHLIEATMATGMSQEEASFKLGGSFKKEEKADLTSVLGSVLGFSDKSGVGKYIEPNTDPNAKSQTTTSGIAFW